jgi:tetratricopeptide (TPR) repeat protein
VRRTAARVFLHASLAAAAAAAPAAAQAPAATPSTVISVSASANRSFDALWADYKRATDAGSEDDRVKSFRSIRWYRVERNIRSLDSLALALVARGQDQLKKGNREKAEDEFRNAVALDPHLADAHFGLARAEMAKGPMGIASGLDDFVSAMVSRLPTALGRYAMISLVVAIGFVVLLAMGTVFALAILLRHGTLLVHDIEESLGLGSRAAATGVFMVFLLVPVMTLQGYGWLPLWWMALLFVYMTRLEQVLAALFVAATLAAGPSASLVEAYVAAQQNPLLRASIRSIETAPDSRASGDLRAAIERFPDDRDLKYLMALQHKKAGRYDEARKVYDSLLATDGNDGVALNNKANILFAEGAHEQAESQYELAAKLPSSNAFLATYNYNLSLARLQQFKYEASHAARTAADDYDRALCAGYEGLWKADRGGGSEEAAVVDLAPTPDEVWGKFTGVRDGVGRQNNIGRGGGLLDPVSPSAVVNRFLGFVVVFVLTVGAISRWRGGKAFTMRCQKCGTPFCRKCQLTAAVAGLCTQCHHLFVVRDGVSGPARNQKLAEVQKEEVRRLRVFRILSILSPGAGQIYAQKALLGLPIVALWYALIAVVLLGGRLVSFTDAPSALIGPWGTILVAFLLVVLFVMANRFRPDFDFSIPASQRSPRRMPAARAS